MRVVASFVAVCLLCLPGCTDSTGGRLGLERIDIENPYHPYVEVTLTDEAGAIEGRRYPLGVERPYIVDSWEALSCAPGPYTLGVLVMSDDGSLAGRRNFRIDCPAGPHVIEMDMGGPIEWRPLA